MAGVKWRNKGQVLYWNRTLLIMEALFVNWLCCRKANLSDLVLKLAVNCSIEVAICHQNSWGKFMHFKSPVCARLLLCFVGFITQKWPQWVSNCHKSANFSDRMAIPKTLLVQSVENLLQLKFRWKSIYPSVQCFFRDGGQNGQKRPKFCGETRK